MFNFYFDEAFHDQKITNIEGVLNSMTENALDNYIGVFLGLSEELLKDAEIVFLEFEQKYRKVFSIHKDNELKSRQIKIKQYKYGLKSFNNDQFTFYLDYFNLIDKYISKIQIIPISKIEFLIGRFVKYLKIENYLYNKSAFIYSITKFIYTYHTKEIINSLFQIQDINSAENFKKELINLLNIVIAEIRYIKRKQIEVGALSQLKFLLESSYFTNISPVCTLNFSYVPDFEGLSRFLIKLNISKNDVNLLIDEHTQTYNEACRYDFFYVNQMNSKNSIFLRMSDFLAGFIGKMIYGIQNDSSFREEKILNTADIMQNDLATKRILNSNWFSIISNKERCNIYYPLFIDQIIEFESLLEYFSSYSNFDSYNIISSELHSEYCNTTTCEKLEKFYQKLI